MSSTSDIGTRQLGPDPDPAPATGSEPSQRRAAAVAWWVVAAGVGAALLLLLLGGTPTAFVLALGLALVLVMGQHLPWMGAVAGVAPVMAAAYLPAMVFGPDIGQPLAVTMVPAYVLLATGVLAVTWRRLRRGVLRVPTRAQSLVGVAAGLLPAAGGAAILVSQHLLAPPVKLAWLMHNDSAWHVMLARFQLVDGGIDPVAHPNTAPLTNGLVAGFMAPGRADVSAASLMEHDLLRASQLMVLAIVCIGVLSGLVLAQAARPGSQHRLMAALLGSLFGWTWFVTGLALGLGFWNAVVALVFLISAWLLWFVDEPRLQPVVSFLMILGSAALLATWAPLVVMGAGLAVGVLWRGRHEYLRLRSGRLLAWLVAPTVAVGFFLLVSVPDLRSNPTALGWDGANFTPRLSNVVVPVTLLVGLVLLAGPVRDRFMGGFAIVLGTSAAGLGYLIYQRVSVDASSWGYYPAKFGWLVVVILVLATIQRLVGLTSPRATSWRAAAGSLAAVTLVAVPLMNFFPIQDPRPVSATNPPKQLNDYRLFAMLPVLSVLSPNGASDFDDAAQAMIDNSSPGNKVLFSRYFAGDPTRDAFVNFWLLQQTSLPAPGHEVRYFNYTLNPEDAAQLCQAAQVWGSDTTIVTSDPAWEDRIHDACPDVEFAVRVESPPS